MALLDTFVTVLLMLGAAVFRPAASRCPDGYWLSEGVRMSGAFVCQRNVPARWVVGPRGGAVDASPDTDDRFVGRVYCSSGTRPVIVNGIAVGCQRGGWK